MSKCPLNAKKTRALSELCGIEFDRVLCHNDGIWAEARQVGETTHLHFTVNRRTGAVIGHGHDAYGEDGNRPTAWHWRTCSDVPPASLGQGDGRGTWGLD